MVKEVQSQAKERMQKANEALQRDLAAIRSGRASPALIEHVRVDYYGTPMPINQLATVAVPEARLLAIQPWDRQAVALIEKAIQKSDLGLNPSSDGSVIRLVIPPLTEDRRKELVKQVHKRVEEAHVAVRNVRRDALEELKRLEHGRQISEDELHRAQEQLQKVTDSAIAEADRLGKGKEAELMEV